MADKTQPKHLRFLANLPQAAAMSPIKKRKARVTSPDESQINAEEPTLITQQKASMSKLNSNFESDNQRMRNKR